MALVLLGVGGLTGCAESQAVDGVLPYWNAPVASSPSVLQAARKFDPTGKPFPNLASVPARPVVSASERIASLSGELSADLDRAADLRATGGRSESRPLDQIGGLDEFTVEPAPEAPSLGRVPAIDLGGANTVRLPLTRDGAGVAVGPDGLPLRDLTAPTPPPRLSDVPSLPSEEPPPAPVLDELPVPAAVNETPPAFVVEPIANAKPASIPPPPTEVPVELPAEITASAPPSPIPDPPPFEGPVMEAPPAFLDAPPAFDIASAPRLEPLPATIAPAEASTAIPVAWVDVTAAGGIADQSATELDTLIAQSTAEGGRLRYRLVGYADGEAVTADLALGRARLVSDYMQARNIERGRLILAPPEVLSNDPRIGSVAVFVLP